MTLYQIKRFIKDMNIMRTIFRSPLILKSGIASMDQGMLSAANFLIAIILIKTVAKVDYGYYSIAFSISLFLISVQNAIVNTPLAVLLVTKKGGEKKAYAASLCYGQFLALLPAVCLGLAVIIILRSWGLDSTQASVATALCIGAVGLLFREFLRAYYFAEEVPLQVLKMDALYVALLLCLIALSYLFLTISVAVILILMGVSGLLSALVFSRNRDWEYRQESIREGYRENWKLGKWALLGVFVTHVQNYSYLYLLGALLGSVAVAEVSAARLLLMPLMFVQEGWGKIAVPHGSKLREQNRIERFFKEQILVSLIVTLGTAAYLVLVLTFRRTIVGSLLSGKYENSLDYVLFWGAIFIIRFITQNASYGLQVTKNFPTISKMNFVTMLVTVGSAYLLIGTHGIEGGLAALIVGGVLLAGALWFSFGKTVLSTRDQPIASAKENLVPILSKGDPVPLLDD